MADNGISDLASVYTNETFKKTILDDMTRLGIENKFTGLEKVKDITLTADPFTIENNILTPTFKLKRNVAKTIFQQQFDEMYAKLEKAGR